MLSWLFRHRLTNNTNRTLYLREVIMTLGICIHETRLDPGITIDNFPATIYWDHNHSLCGDPSVIVVFVGEYKSFGSLTPFHFMKYIELIFEIDEGNNTLIVSGIESRPMDYFPFRCISLVKTLKRLRFQERPSYLWKYITKREFGRDCSDRPKVIVMISGFKGSKAKNKGNLLSGQEAMTIYVMINYDGERKKNGVWSSGAHAKWEAILVDKNNLTVDGVADQICATLGLNRIRSKLMFSHVPESYSTNPYYIQDSKGLKRYLTFGRRHFRTIPRLHVKIVENKNNIEQRC